MAPPGGCNWLSPFFLDALTWPLFDLEWRVTTYGSWIVTDGSLISPPFLSLSLNR